MPINAALLPKNWRKKLPETVKLLPFPDVSMALEAGDAILGSRTESEVGAIANDLWHRLAHEGEGAILETSFIPRAIYSLHNNSFSLASTEKEHLPATLLEHLAVGALVELWRACRTWANAENQKSWNEAATAAANARTLSDWIYILDVTGIGSAGSDSPISKQAIRKAAKEKIKKSKSAAATKGWRKQLKPSKQLVFEYFEQHKTEFKSLAKAATAIASKKLVNEGYSTIYTWLRKYVKKQQTK